jgi:type III polyketide synthase
VALICEPASAHPPHRVAQTELVEALVEQYPDAPALRTGVRMIEHTQVRHRNFIRPILEVLAQDGVASRNRTYVEEARRYGGEAATAAMERAGVPPADVDVLIVTSCTGFPMPGLDAMLCNDLDGLEPAVRLPVSQLGCSAGAAAFGYAHEFCRSGAGAVVLVVCVELSSLCFQESDLFAPMAISSFVSTGLFGDGAAAVVVRADERGAGFVTEASGMHLLPDSEDFIAYTQDEHGIHFNTNPAMLQALERMTPAIHTFLARHGCEASELDFLISHTGGPKVLDGIVAGLGLPEERVAVSRESLAEVGNLSSVTVIDVLDRTFRRYRPEPGQRGLVIGIGPGVTTSMVLGHWQEDPAS